MMVGLQTMACANRTGQGPTSTELPAGAEAAASLPKCPPPVAVEVPEAELVLLGGGPDPSLPERMRVRGVVFIVIAKICISGDGSVKDVTIVKGADSTVNQNVKDAHMQRKYCPWHTSGAAVTYCHFATTRFDTR